MRGLLFVAAALGGLLGAVNISFAQTWRQTTAPTDNFYAVASSGDGNKLVAVPFLTACKFYVSTNAGVSWITNSSTGLVQPVSSADGTRCAGMMTYTGLHVSTNSGILWQPAGVLTGLDNFGNTALSADGNTIVVPVGNTLNISTNFGVTWISENAPSGGLIMIPANSSNWLIANTHTAQNANIYTSTNMGTTWMTNSLPSTNVTAFATSADGNKIIACENSTTGSPTYVPGNIYISTNSGGSWVKSFAPSNSWTSVASSADGSKLVAVANPLQPLRPLQVGGIYTSTDGGKTWVSNSVPITSWIAVASSADGNKLVAAVQGGGIYTSYSKPSPQLNVASMSNTLTFSWTLPSTNLVLQQSSDLASWSLVTNAPVLNYTNLQYQVSLAPTNNNGFFRLISQ